MSSTLIKNPYEQWVHTYLTIVSKPMWKLQQGYCQEAAYDASDRNLYPLPKPDNRTIAQEGWVSFVKGIMSMYEIDDFRSACSKAKQVIVSRHTRKSPMDLWTELPRNKKEAALTELKKVLEEAEKKESRTHDDLWNAEACEEESTMDYNRMKKDLEQQEEIMKEMIQARKDADKAYVAAQEAVKVAKKALEDASAAASAAAAAPPAPTSSCDLPFTDGAFKSLKPCKATLVPGTYYIGDPCYPLGDSWIYKKAWDASRYNAPAYFHSDRGTLVVDYTAWGDGTFHEYHDEKGDKTREYHVDSGTISIISVALIHDEVERQKKECTKPESFKRLITGGHMYTFKEEVEVDFEDGVFIFNSGWNSFSIDTDGCVTCRQETDDEYDE